MKMHFEDPLDFEFEDQHISPSRSINKRRRKVIGLDDLLNDHYEEKIRLEEKEAKKRRLKRYDSDEDDDRARNGKETLLSRFVADCQKQVSEMVAEDEIPTWGLRLFGPKKDPPQWDFTGLGNCKLLEASVDSEINSMLELDSEEGDNFLEGLLMNGWLSNWVFTCGHLEDSIALWAFYQMLYSTNEELQISACDFWCSVLRNDTEVDASIIRLTWHPKYAELRDALNIYGYLMDSSANYSSHSTAVHEEV